MSEYGLDLSKHNGTVDFNAIKNAGHTFVILRVGYGVNGTKDPKFEEYYQQAKAVGLKVGAYYYSYALNVSGAENEANNFLNYVAGKQFEMPVYIDMEDADNYKQKNGFPSNSTLNQICNRFCEIVQSHGYYVGVYASQSWFASKLTLLGDYTKWIARYGSNNGTMQYDYSDGYGMYQFTSNYKLNGKTFDRNISYVDFTSAIKTNGLNGYGANTPVEPVTPSQPDTSTSADLSKQIIAEGQQHSINFTGHNIAVDGIYGSKTKANGIRCVQNAMNLDYNAGLKVDGAFGTKSSSALGSHYVKKGETQYLVTAVEILLMLRGYDPQGVECPGVFGSGLQAAVKQYQADAGLKVDGIAGKKTIKSLMNG